MNVKPKTDVMNRLEPEETTFSLTNRKTLIPTNGL